MKIRKNIANDPEIAEAIEEIEKTMEGNGRVLIRPSGTEPLVSVMLEGEDEEACWIMARQSGRSDRREIHVGERNMCGIVGYIGDENAKDIIIDGLKKLEYRGYDSAGIAVIRDGQLEVKKHVGGIANLEKLIGDDPMESHIGIGHTRWATHGAPSDVNAHPHVDQDGR